MHLKKALFLLFLSAASFACGQGFETKVSFDAFTDWVSGLGIQGYQFMEAEKEGDTEFNEPVNYTAKFANMQTRQMVSFSLHNIKEFQRYASFDEPVQINGMRVVFSSQGEGKLLMLIAEIPGLPAAAELLFFPTGTREKASSIFNTINFEPLISASGRVSWPSEIPEDARINANVLQISKSTASTDGYQYEYTVSVAMDSGLIDELKRLQSRYNTFGLDVIKVDKLLDIVCADAQDIENLKKYKREHETVSFIYYVK